MVSAFSGPASRHGTGEPAIVFVAEKAAAPSKLGKEPDPLATNDSAPSRSARGA